MIIEITRRYELIAGHFLPNVSPNHKCRRPHGHNYELEVSIQGPLDPKLAWIMDYWDLDAVIEPVLSRLDHRMLNEVAGLENPTAEIIADWFFDRLKNAIPHNLRLSQVRVFETRDCIATVINDGKPWSTL